MPEIPSGDISLEVLAAAFLAQLYRREKKERERVLEKGMEILGADAGKAEREGGEENGRENREKSAATV